MLQMILNREAPKLQIDAGLASALIRCVSRLHDGNKLVEGPFFFFFAFSSSTSYG